MVCAIRHGGGTRFIAGRPEAVFDFLADARHERLWDLWAGRIMCVSAGECGRGTRFRGRFANLGDVEIELVDYARPRLLRQARRGAFGEFRCTYTLEPVPGGTRLRWRGEVIPAAATSFLVPLLRAVLRRHLHAQADALADACWSWAEDARRTGT